MDEMIKQSIVKIHFSRDDSNAVGVGFIFLSEGFLLTCMHVIRNTHSSKDLWISWKGLIKPVRAKVLEEYSDPPYRKDFAILEVSKELDRSINLPPTLNISSDVEPGDIILTRGVQNSKFDTSPASGVVLGTVKRIQDKSTFWMLKNSGYVNQGLSGGPAINTRTGKVIGIFSEQFHQKASLLDYERPFLIDKGSLITPIKEIAIELQKRDITCEPILKLFSKFIQKKTKVLEINGIDYFSSKDYFVILNLTIRPNYEWLKIWNQQKYNSAFYYKEQCSVELKNDTIIIIDTIKKTETIHVREINNKIRYINERLEQAF